MKRQTANDLQKLVSGSPDAESLRRRQTQLDNELSGLQDLERSIYQQKESLEDASNAFKETAMKLDNLQVCFRTFCEMQCKTTDMKGE